MDSKPSNNIIYTVTVIDDSALAHEYRRTPAIFTDLEAAMSLVKNNDQNIAESGDNGYAIIEQTLLNEILPTVKSKIWFEWNRESGSYELIETPAKFSKVLSVALS